MTGRWSLMQMIFFRELLPKRMEEWQPKPLVLWIFSAKREVGTLPKKKIPAMLIACNYYRRRTTRLRFKSSHPILRHRGLRTGPELRQSSTKLTFRRTTNPTIRALLTIPTPTTTATTTKATVIRSGFFRRATIGQ